MIGAEGFVTALRRSVTVDGCGFGPVKPAGDVTPLGIPDSSVRRLLNSAVIVAGEETKVLLRENGLNSTVVKTVVDGYLQSKEMFVNLSDVCLCSAV